MTSKVSGVNFSITAFAAAELVRQSAFAGTPGAMTIDLIEDRSGEGWLHIQLSPGSNNGIPSAPPEGITLFASASHAPFLQGLLLNYFGNSIDGGFLITSPDGAEC